MSEFCNNPESPHQSAEQLPRLTEAKAEEIIHGSGPIDFRTYMELQMRFILGPDNKWFAGEKLGHPANKDELAMHFNNFGGADWFRETFRPRYEAYLEQKNNNRSK